jgi:NmrA-like family
MSSSTTTTANEEILSTSNTTNISEVSNISTTSISSDTTTTTTSNLINISSINLKNSTNLPSTSTLSSSTSSTSSTTTTTSSTTPPTTKRTIVVIGCTGRQGGGFIRALEEREKRSEWKIIGVTRDITSPEAKALATRGVILETGDTNDRASLDRILSTHSPVYAFFAVTNPFGFGPSRRWSGTGRAFGDTNAEEKQGIHMVDACKAANVSHFIFTSSAGASGSDVATMEVKAKIETYLIASGLKYSIVAPVGFYENLLNAFAGIKQGVVPGLIKEETRVQVCRRCIYLYVYFFVFELVYIVLFYLFIFFSPFRCVLLMMLVLLHVYFWKIQICGLERNWNLCVAYYYKISFYF